MKVTVRSLGPLLREALGARELQVDLPGRTVRDLLDHLARERGPAMRRALFDEEGALDPIVQVLVNEERWVRADEIADAALFEGDTVTLLVLVAGG